LANAFTLFAEIKADTSVVDRAMRSTEKNAESLTKELTRTEHAAEAIGHTSATTAQKFQQLRGSIAASNQRVRDAANAFKAGHISARQMATVINQAGRSAITASNQIKTLTARLSDLRAKQAAVAGKPSSSFIGSNEFLAGVTGGLAGAGIAGAGLAAFGMTKQLVSGIATLGTSAIQMAADFQQTKNAMTVFTGSSEKAKVELAALAELSKKTPGLSLVDAEQGATRLRAMGFAADTANKLLVGLAKQKILSGVGSEAIDRTTLNLAQLASGGGDFQDIKDLVQNLPTARKEINEAFGSLQGFQAALKANPQEAIKRLADELAGVTAPAGGFNDALQKLNDSLLISGRAFGEPIVEPLTESMRILTETVYGSEGAWRSWGQTVGDQITAINQLSRGALNIGGVLGNLPGNPIGNTLSQIVSQQLPGGSLIASALSATGQALRLAGGTGLGAGMSGQLAPATNTPSGNLKAAIEQIEMEARARKENQAALANYHGYIQRLNQSAFSVQEAQLSNHLSKTQASELQSIRQNAALKEQQIRAEMRTDQIYFREAMKMAVPGEQGAIQMKANEAAAKSQAELRINALKSATAIREAYKKIKTEIASIFTSGYQSNPFVQIFEQGRLAIERVKEATMGLNPALRATLLTLTAAATATQTFGQALENKLQASNLRNEARQFLSGSLDAETPYNFQKNLDRQLRAIGAVGSPFGVTDDKQRLIDKQIIGILGQDPTKLNRSQQILASDARVREAGRLESEEREAKEVQRKLLTVLQNLEGNKALEIAISDPTSRTAIGATSANVNARYKQ
jgi:hypothetical protein